MARRYSAISGQSCTYQVLPSHDRLIAQQEQGWSFADGEFACDECVEEPSLKQWVSLNADEHGCSYCGRHSAETPLAVSVNELFGFIDEGLRTAARR